MAILSFASCTLSLFLVSIFYSRNCGATTYLVGGSGGWDPSTDLDAWVANKTFHAGDMLWFLYSRYHSVSEVDKAGYDNCSTTNAILTGTIGNTNVTLKKSPGADYYFISGRPLYCFGGMRLKASVKRGNETKFAPAASPVPPKIQPQAPPSVSRHSNGKNISPTVVGNSATNGYDGGKKDAVLKAVLLAVVSVLLH